MLSFKTIDVMSIVLAVGCFTLLALGRDTIITYILLAIASAHLGIQHVPSVKRRARPPAKPREDRTASLPDDHRG